MSDINRLVERAQTKDPWAASQQAAQKPAPPKSAKKKKKKKKTQKNGSLNGIDAWGCAWRSAAIYITLEEMITSRPWLIALIISSALLVILLIGYTVMQMRYVNSQ